MEGLIMSKKDDKLDEILARIEELTDMLIVDMQEELNSCDETIQAFRITEKVYKEMDKELGKGWMENIGIT